MGIAYFFECLTPGQTGVSRRLQRLVAARPATCWVMVAAPGLAEGPPAAAVADPAGPSTAQEITRDLAGWSLPRPGAA